MLVKHGDSPWLQIIPEAPTGAPADVAQMHQGSWDQNRIRRWSPRPGGFCLASNRCFWSIDIDGWIDMDT